MVRGGGECSTVPPSPSSPVVIREVRPCDEKELRECHMATLEIAPQYPAEFYFKATHGCEGMVGWVALDPTSGRIVGYVTAQVQSASSISALEGDPFSSSECTNILVPSFWTDASHAIYILTLGVLQGHRHLGIATSLVDKVKTFGCKSKCKFLYLHTVDYNAKAAAFYSKNGFRCQKRLPEFYTFPNSEVHDALAFAWSPDLAAQGLTERTGAITTCSLLPKRFWEFINTLLNTNL